MGDMKENVRRLDAEYKFGLTEEEMTIIAKQAEDAERLFQSLFAVDLTGVMPLMKVDRKPALELGKRPRRKVPLRSPRS